MGKGILSLIGFFSFLTLTVGLLSACGLPARLSRNIGTGETLLPLGLEGRWAGPVTPSDAGCGISTKGLMSVSASAFAFDPFQGTTVIQGKVEERRLEGVLSRPGPDKQVLSIAFSGQGQRDANGENAIVGTLVSGHCHWNVVLKRE